MQDIGTSHEKSRRMWYVRCQNVPALTPMVFREAVRQARWCDENYPQCGPHEVFSAAWLPAHEERFRA